MNDVLVSIADLHVSFDGQSGDIQAVRGVSFSVRQGEIVGIVGESGSGKSVSTLALPGLLPVHATVSGSIKYKGQEISALDVRALRAYRGRKIGMIFQEPGRSYDPLQSIGKVFLETLRNSLPDITREQAEIETIRLLGEVGLDNAGERLANYPHQFSGGQLQRIGIALALAQGCELLVADEPTTALDVTIQAQIVALLLHIRQTRGISIIFISHNIDLVAEISDRILVMYGGLIMEEGPAQEIASSPSHPYTRALLDAAPRFGGHYSIERLRSIPGKVPDPIIPEPGCPFAPRCPRVVDACTRAIPALRIVMDSEFRQYRCILEPENRK
jgi:peptide/nickel transport system permease protein